MALPRDLHVARPNADEYIWLQYQVHVGSNTIANNCSSGWQVIGNRQALFTCKFTIYLYLVIKSFDLEGWVVGVGNGGAIIKLSTKTKYWNKRSYLFEIATIQPKNKCCHESTSTENLGATAHKNERSLTLPCSSRREWSARFSVMYVRGNTITFNI